MTEVVWLAAGWPGRANTWVISVAMRFAARRTHVARVLRRFASGRPGRQTGQAAQLAASRAGCPGLGRRGACAGSRQAALTHKLKVKQSTTIAQTGWLTHKTSSAANMMCSLLKAVSILGVQRHVYMHAEHDSVLENGSVIVTGTQPTWLRMHASRHRCSHYHSAFKALGARLTAGGPAVPTQGYADVYATFSRAYGSLQTLLDAAPGQFSTTNRWKLQRAEDILHE